ncbi:DUF6471 domain-containing protein [Brevundimonas nasdae]|uniref:DUF6471 domain-containing protein n=1 Tax=Brevundimonas nasdae TaxID=172043 RepID=UPI00289A6775|nr:DUF6471 domain-containing protein [Brevundimonas nasdae]
MTNPPAELKPATLNDEEWRDAAKRVIKVELKRRGVTYADLSQLLAEIGVEESETSIRNKVSRGTFSFVFALQTMKAIGVELIPFKPDVTFTSQLPPELLARMQRDQG